MKKDFYIVVKGTSFSALKEESFFTEPGTSRPIEQWEQSSPLLAAAKYNSVDKTAYAVKERWRKAQGAEISFWRNWRQNELYKHVSLAEFWADVVCKTGGPLPGGKVLDIGCGPVSVLNFERGPDMEPIGLDPLAEAYAKHNLIEARSGWDSIPMVGLSAERLPFADESLDHILCYNVLDHVSDAPTVIQEIRRILKPGGTLRLYVHTFRSWMKRFLFFDKPHTYHWDHAEFKSLILSFGFKLLGEFLEPKTFDMPEGFSFALIPYMIAGKVTSTSYFQLRK